MVRGGGDREEGVVRGGGGGERRRWFFAVDVSPILIWQPYVNRRLSLEMKCGS